MEDYNPLVKFANCGANGVVCDALLQKYIASHISSDVYKAIFSDYDLLELRHPSKQRVIDPATFKHAIKIATENRKGGSKSGYSADWKENALAVARVMPEKNKALQLLNAVESGLAKSYPEGYDFARALKIISAIRLGENDVDEVRAGVLATTRVQDGRVNPPSSSAKSASVVALKKTAPTSELDEATLSTFRKELGLSPVAASAENLASAFLKNDALVAKHPEIAAGIIDAIADLHTHFAIEIVDAALAKEFSIPPNQREFAKRVFAPTLYYSDRNLERFIRNAK